jgi:hypothetical protein
MWIFLARYRPWSDNFSHIFITYALKNGKIAHHVQSYLVVLFITYALE